VYGTTGGNRTKEKAPVLSGGKKEPCRGTLRAKTIGWAQATGEVTGAKVPGTARAFPRGGATLNGGGSEKSEKTPQKYKRGMQRVTRRADQGAKGGKTSNDD